MIKIFCRILLYWSYYFAYGSIMLVLVYFANNQEKANYFTPDNNFSKLYLWHITCSITAWITISFCQMVYKYLMASMNTLWLTLMPASELSLSMYSYCSMLTTRLRPALDPVGKQLSILWHFYSFSYSNICQKKISNNINWWCKQKSLKI